MTTFTRSDGGKAEDSWEAHKDAIYQLYISEKGKLQGPDGVISKMRLMYNFDKSKAQYERRLKQWSFCKNSTKRKWIEIASEVLKRQERGIESEVVLDGSPIPPKKLRKEVQRYRRCLDERVCEGERFRKPTGWSIRTPLATDLMDLYPEDPQVFRDWQLPVAKSSHFTLPIHRSLDLPFASSLPISELLKPQTITLLEADKLLSQFKFIFAKSSCAFVDSWKSLLSADFFVESLDLPVPDMPISMAMGAEGLIQMTLFLVSNNLFDDMENANSQVLEWFQAERDPRLIRYLRARNNHNSEAVAEKLFRYAIVEGDATIVKALLDTGLSPDEPCCPWPAGTPWYTKDTLAKPLQLACLLGHAQLISLLVEGNAEVNTTADGGPSPIQCVLHSAVCAPNEARKRVEYLISKGATVDPPIGSLEISALALAGRSGNLQLVQYLILYGANVNHRDGDGRSVLHAAIEGGINDYRQLPIVRLLLEAGSDHSIEFMNENQIYTPMRLALQSRSLDLLQLLLQFGAMPSDDNIIELCTRRDLVFVAQALHLALTRRLPHRFSGLISGEGAISRFEYHDSLDLARWIVEMLSHDDIPPPVREGCLGNCLFTAIERQSERTAACFLQAGADTRCSLGTLIALGVMKDNSRLVDLLLRAGANPCWLSRAVQWRNLDMVKTLLDAGANLEGIIDGESYTPLVMAIKIESPELISYILDAGADVNNASATKNGHSALAMAVHKQDTELVKRLLSLGANPKDSNALLEAVTSENLNLLLILLAAANPTILKGKAKFGCSALQEAIRLWNPAFIQKLIANGVPVNEFPPRYPQDVIGGRHRLRKGNTALGIAIIEDGTQGLLVLKAILAAGGNANSVVELRPKKTALLLAIAYRNVPAVELLISAGADTGLAASNGIRHTPLQAACEKGLVQVVRKLLQLGVQVNAAPATRYGATALQFAAIGGFIGIVSLLLEHGADVNAPGAAWEGRTALEAAAEHGRIDMVHLFVNIGARIVGPGSEQYDRAREFARKRGHNALRRLLESLHATQMSNEFKI